MPAHTARDRAPQPRRRRATPAAPGGQRDVRREIARDLHDTVAQSLATMLLELEGYKAEQYGRASVLKSLDDLQGMARQALDELRQLLHDLRDDEGYEADLAGKIDGLLATFTARTDVRSSSEYSDAWVHQRLTKQAAKHVLGVVTEALNNAWRHGGATEVRVVCNDTPDLAVVTIVDNGRGFAARTGYVEGLGIHGMRERAVLLGADFQIDSEEGAGTVISLLIPRNVII